MALQSLAFGMAGMRHARMASGMGWGDTVHVSIRGWLGSRLASVHQRGAGWSRFEPSVWDGLDGVPIGNLEWDACGAVQAR